MPMATPSERDVRLKSSYSIEEGHFTDLLCDAFERRRDLTHISSACGFGACVGKTCSRNTKIYPSLKKYITIAQVSQNNLSTNVAYFEEKRSGTRQLRKKIGQRSQ